jgi:hypothetical protein
MLNITELAEELQELTAWQDTPQPLEAEDYIRIVKRAVRNFFVDINHASEYSEDNYIIEEPETNIFYNREFYADEIVYILILCQIEFFQRVQTDVNNAFGYTTNALTVTNADKPYKNLAETLNGLFNERRIKFNKMVRYTLGE